MRRPRAPASRSRWGFAAYFELVVTRENAFRLLYGRNDAEDAELGQALRRVEDAIAEAIEPLIAAGLEPDHRRFLAYAVVGMAEGASRHWIATRAADGPAAEAAPGGGRAPRHSGWRPAWPTSPGPGSARSTPTDAAPATSRGGPPARRQSRQSSVAQAA